MVKLANYARPERKVGDSEYYTWRIFVDEPKEVLDTIRDVQYILHPTFPEPVQDRDDPDDQFALETSGWGEFKIAARVTYKDGKTEDVTHELKLTNEWPAEASMDTTAS